jgi:excisionase family DNA binding protein
MFDDHAVRSLLFAQARRCVRTAALTCGRIESISIAETLQRGGNAMVENSSRMLGNRRNSANTAGHFPSNKYRAGYRELQAQEENSGKATRGAIPFGERLACTVAEACEATGIGRTKLYELIGNGQLQTTTLGRRRLVKVQSLLALLEAEHK